MERLTDPKRRRLVQTILLASTVFAVPLLLGTLFVALSQRMPAESAEPHEERVSRLLTQLRAAVSVEQLTSLRHELREAGVDTEEADLRIWAARAREPELLWRVAPPDDTEDWGWSLAQDGLYALAVSTRSDAVNRRDLGLYDLIREEWVWKSLLPWPQTIDELHVFDRRAIIRYTMNGARFALEIDRQGRIASLDRMGDAPVRTAPPAVLGHPLLPGRQGAGLKHNVFFTVDAQDGALCGYASRPLPGLRPAGTNGTGAVFSGNGLLKLEIADGTARVVDALTLTPLQSFEAWQPSDNTLVAGAQATMEGDLFSIFLATSFDGENSVKRNWSVTIDTYQGTLKRNLSPDTQFAFKERLATLEVTTPDGRWRLAAGPDNLLTVADAAAPAAPPLASIALAPLGIAAPLRSLEFLEGGRYLALRQDGAVWLLDFTMARRYGNLLARTAGAERTITMESYRVKRDTDDKPSTASAEGYAQLALAEEGYGIDEEYDYSPFAMKIDEDATAPMYYALRAEHFLACQAWGYAAALLEETARLQEYDSRAPRVNPLLLARCQILAGESRKAQATCRAGLRALAALPLSYDIASGGYQPPKNVDLKDTRMIRYHLQGLLFAQ